MNAADGSIPIGDFNKTLTMPDLGDFTHLIALRVAVYGAVGATGGADVSIYEANVAVGGTTSDKFTEAKFVTRGCIN